MPGILSRYIFRETALTWAAVTVILLAILVTNQFASVLEDAAEAQLPRDAILVVMGYSSVQYLTILIPVGLFLSILLALARFYRDSEMAAIMACGVGTVSLYRPLMLLAIVLSGAVAWLALDIAPASLKAIEVISEDAKQRADLALLEPGRFVSFGKDSAVLYAEAVSEQGKLSKVFVQRRRGDKVEVIVADRASQRSDGETGLRILTFHNGKRYEGTPGQPDFRIISFGEHGIPYEMPTSKSGEPALETMSMRSLLDEEGLGAIAEIQWRLSAPLSLIVLTLIAVPLSRTSPRQGRYGNLAAGVLVYVIYANLLGAAKVWVEQGDAPPIVGLWWVHVLFAGFGGVVLLRQQGVFTRLLHARRAREPAA